MPKVLGVDDSATMRTILEMTFAGESGVEVSTVDSGDAAISWVTQNGADIVLADASMPGMDGYEIAAALRGNAATAGTAIIVLASQHTPFDAERGRTSGVDDHVLKPFETQALIDKVKDVMQRPRAAASGAPSAARVAPPAPPAPPRPAAPARPVPAPAAPAAASSRAPARATVAFGAPPGARPPTAPPGGAQRVVAPPMAPAAPRKPTLELADEKAAAARPAAAAAATASNGDMAGKLAGMGLSPEQVDGVLALSREVIERVVWEVVPDLAETIIRDEIRRLTAD